MAEQWQATCLASEQALSGQPLLLRRQGLSTATVRPPQLFLGVAADPRLKPRPSQSSSGFRRLTTSRFRRRQQGQRPLQKLLVCGWHLRNTVLTSLERHGELCVRLSPLGASRTQRLVRGETDIKTSKARFAIMDTNRVGTSPKAQRQGREGKQKLLVVDGSH